MHFYNFNPADFNNSARHLSLVERALYRDLIDMYYCDESPIDGSDMPRLERRLLCRTQDEKDALAYVLSEFFTKRGNKFHHHRIDNEIKNYRYAHRNDKVTDSNATSNERNGQRNATVTDSVTQSNDTVTDVTPLSNAERQQRNRAERKQMIDDLNMIGVSVTANAGTKLLRELTEINAEKIRNAKSSNHSNEVVTPSVTDSNAPSNESNAKIDAITSNQEPVTKNQVNNTTQHAGEAKSLQSVESVPVAPVSQFDIRTWDAPGYGELLNILGSEGVIMVLPFDTYETEVDKFKAYNANQVAQGKPALSDEKYRLSKFVDWFKILAEKQAKESAQSAQLVGYEYDDNDDLPAIYRQPVRQNQNTGYHPSHAKPTPQLDPAKSVRFNGVAKPCLPNMDRQQTWDYVKLHQMAGETADETYDRVANELMSGAA